MPEVPFESDTQNVQNDENNDVEFDPVCIDVARIYDSCGAKDCLRNLTVFFTAEDQALVDKATSARVTKVSVLSATVNVDSVAFHRGYYSVDIVFYFAICAEIYTGKCAMPETVTGLATHGKRVVLYGSDGNVKTFSSNSAPVKIDASEFDCCRCCSGTNPEATVQVSSPVVLASELAPVTVPKIPPYVPKNIAKFFGCELVAPTCQQVLVTLGVFSIVQLTRNVQLTIPSYDFCVPRKECDARTDDPCEAFSKIEFPTDSFFPPSANGNESDENPFNCNCK